MSAPLFSDEFVRAIDDWALRFGEALGREFSLFLKAMRPVLDGVRTVYRKAGAPYGDTEEGMLRWLREQRQISDLRAQADRLESIQETCLQLRRSIVAKSSSNAATQPQRKRPDAP